MGSTRLAAVTFATYAAITISFLSGMSSLYKVSNLSCHTCAFAEATIKKDLF